MDIGPHEIDHTTFLCESGAVIIIPLLQPPPCLPYISALQVLRTEYYFGRGLLKTLSSLASQMSVKPAVSTGRFQEGCWLGTILQSIQVILSYLFQDTFNV